MTYFPGQWKTICDRCGREYLNRELRLEYTGLRCCGDCWEPRHPQERVRAKADKETPPWVRPEGPDVFVEIEAPDWDDL